jgi:signal transduction histidine kinase
VGRPLSCDEGPCGTALSLKAQVIVSDAASDTRWGKEAWPAIALAHGLRSCWCSPLLSLSGELLGVLAIHQREPGSPAPYHQVLIQQFTYLASIAIEQTQSAEALKRSEAFLAKAQQLSSTGSFSWRIATDEIMWSEQLYRIFELDPNVPVTLDVVASRIHPEDMPMFNEIVGRARRNGGDFEYEHRLRLADGSIKYVHLVAHGTRDADGRLEYIGAVQDVTQSRLSEQALSKARSELAHVSRVSTVGELTASIAHEVNQPLAGIITNASTCLRMLAADPPNVERARETARRMIRDGNRAADVTTRLRALFAKREVSAETLDLNEAAREVIALSMSDLQRSRVVLRAELAEDLPPVRGDRVQLQQVILNLLRNALEAMSAVDDRPRQLVIKTEPHAQDRVCLSVQDAGAGFDDRDVDKLFDAFFTTKSDGMGIGLSVSRSIIESHHGRLWATANDGPGATFSFSIPRSSEDAIALGAPSERPAT